MHPTACPNRHLFFSSNFWTSLLTNRELQQNNHTSLESWARDKPPGHWADDCRARTLDLVHPEKQRTNICSRQKE